MTDSPFGFGGLNRPLDKRDFPLGKVQSPTPIPAVYLPDISSLPTHHQHKLPTCGANSFTWFQEAKFKGRFTPRFSWIRIKAIDGYPLDAGTDMRSIFKSGASDGVCDDFLLPDDSTMDLTPYSAQSAVSQEMKDNAQPKIIQSYAFMEAPFSINQIKQAIYNNKVVLALLRVGESMYSSPSGIISWAEKDIFPLRVPKTIDGGHFVVLYGYDEKYIYFKNSWGPDWGRNGTGYFDVSYLPYVTELGTAIDADPEQVKKMLAQVSILKKLVELWTKLLPFLKKK